MQKKYALFDDVIKIFSDEGILDEVILVGSWCMLFYRDYFFPSEFNPSIRTTDIDFLVPRPIRIRKKIDIAELLKDQGFIVTFNNYGYMRIEHPELIIEFLVPEIGKGSDKPYPIPDLGVNAQALRFLDLLAQNAVDLIYNNIKIKVPHPAAFGLQKLIVSQRRNDKAKSEKEIREALNTLDTIIKSNKTEELLKIYNNMPKKWRTKITRILKDLDRDDVCELLES